MKKLLCTLMLLIPLVAFTQTPDTCFTQEQILFMANQKLEYKAKIQRQDSIIQLYKQNVTLHKEKIEHLNNVITLQEKKITFLEENNTYLKGELERRDKWWKNERLHFTLGFISASVLAILLR